MEEIINSILAFFGMEDEPKKSKPSQLWGETAEEKEERERREKEEEEERRRRTIE